MTDNELLLAISNLFDSKLKPINKEVSEVKDRLITVETEMADMKSEMADMKSEMADMNNRVKNIEYTQENEIIPRLNTIESCYTSTFNRYKASVEDHEAMKQDLSIIKNVLMEHSDKLRKIS